MPGLTVLSRRRWLKQQERDPMRTGLEGNGVETCISSAQEAVSKAVILEQYTLWTGHGPRPSGVVATTFPLHCCYESTM